MRADRLGWRLNNILIGLSFAAALWFFFHEMVHDALFLFPFLWLMHERAIISRVVELNERVEAQNRLISSLLSQVDGDFILDHFDDDDDVN